MAISVLISALRDLPQHIRLPLGQMGRAFFTQKPLRRLAAENLITQMDGDHRGLDRLGRGVLQENACGTRDHCWANVPIGIGGQNQCLGRWALRREKPHKIDTVGWGELQVYQDNVDGFRDTEAQQFRLTLGDLDDMHAIVLAEKPSQSQTEGRSATTRTTEIFFPTTEGPLFPSKGWDTLLLSTEFGPLGSNRDESTSPVSATYVSLNGAL